MSTVAIIAVESHHLIRERTFAVDRGFDDRGVERALHVLSTERFTGQLVIHMTNGTVGSIQCEERSKLLPAAK